MRQWIVYAMLAAMAGFAVFNQPILFLAAGGGATVVASWGHVPKFRIMPRKLDFVMLSHKIYKPKVKSITRPMTRKTKVKKAHGILKVENLSPDTIMTMARVFLRLKVAKTLERWMISVVKTAIFESGAIADSRRISHYSISMAFLAAPPAILGGTILGILVSPVFLAILGVPVALLMSGVINLRIMKSQRESAIEHELPVFIMCSSIMEQVGFNLYVFLERLSKTKTSLFPTIQKDAMLFSRNTTFLAMPHEKALKKIADAHPNQQFKDLVNDYTSAHMTSGASTANTMKSATDSAFRSMRFKIKSYTANAQGIAQMLLLMMTTAPLMSIAASILASGEAALHMSLMIILLMPVMSVMIILMIDGKQPRTHNAADMAREGIVIAIIIGIIMAILGRPVWEILGVSTAVFAGINATKNMKHFRMRANLDRAMPTFLQEVTDGMIEGMSIYESIKRKTDHPNKALRGILYSISKKMYMGMGLVEAAEQVRGQSWLSHVVLFVLGHVHESGMASANIMQAFANFTKDYQESKQEMLSSLRTSIGMGYFIPVMMTGMLVLAVQLVDSIAGDLGDIENLPIALPSVQDAASLTESSFILVVMCSALIGLVVSKIAYFTVKHTLHVCLLSILAVILCHAVPYVPPFF